MADSKFWHTRAEEFRELEKTNCLRLRWWKYADGNDPPLSLSVSDRPRCDSVEARFKLAATQCGKALAGPAVTSAYEHWLNIVISTKGNWYRLSGSSSGRKWAGGSMGKLCEECANLCLTFETAEVEKQNRRPDAATAVVTERLPGLMPSDPRNKLSIEARKRLYRAQAKAEAGIHEAKAQIQVKYGSVFHPNASMVLTKALARAAKQNMAAVAIEFSGLGLQERDYREIMRGEIEAITNSFELNESYRQMLEAEFFYPQEGLEKRPSRVHAAKPSAKKVPVVVAQKRPRQPGTITNLIAAHRAEAYMQQNGLTQSKFARRAGITDRTLRSFFVTGKIRKSLLSGIAKAMKIDEESLLKLKPDHS